MLIEEKGKKDSCSLFTVKLLKKLFSEIEMRRIFVASDGNYMQLAGDS